MKKIDWKKIKKGALVAISGAMLAYVADALPMFNIPESYMPLAVAGLSVLANILRKYATA